MPYERFFAPLRMTRNKTGKLFNHESLVFPLRKGGPLGFPLKKGGSLGFPLRKGGSLGFPLKKGG
jgi:hypothetical protein